jgi:predicted transcriptional regulator
MNTQRMTITLPGHMADRVRKQAKEDHRPVSRIIAEALERQEKERIDQLMIEGAKEFAALNRELAEEFWPIVGETWPGD